MINFDIAVYVIVGLSALFGFVRGFTKEVLGVCSWVAALAVAYLGFPMANQVALLYIKNPNIAEYATYIGIFITFLILFSIVSNLLSSLIRQTVLSGIDRTLGFGFGLARSLLILAVVDLALGFFFPKDPAFLEQSKTIPHVRNLSRQLYVILPDDVKKILSSKSKISLDLNEDKQKKTPEQIKLEQEKNAEDLAQLRPQVAQETTTIPQQAVDKILDETKQVIQGAETAKELLNVIG